MCVMHAVSTRAHFELHLLEYIHSLAYSHKLSSAISAREKPTSSPNRWALNLLQPWLVLQRYAVKTLFDEAKPAQALHIRYYGLFHAENRDVLVPIVLIPKNIHSTLTDQEWVNTYIALFHD